VELQPRRVTIYRIELLHYAWPVLELEVHCGKGTYIRSLGRDLGEQLGCGGLVQTLRRTQVGPFTSEGAVTLATPANAIMARLRPAVDALLELPRIVLQPAEAIRLSQGQSVPRPRSADAISAERTEIAVVDTSGRLVGLARWDPARGLLKPAKMWRD
jgi:tRNA pseudouridine55 synthase